MPKNYKLTPRQWRVYNFYKEQGENITPQKDVIEYLSELYPPVFEYQNFHDSTARLQLTADIRAINACPTIQKIIISTPQGNKIANEEEYSRYVFKEFYSTLEKLNRCKQKIRKGSMNGQFRIVLGKERDVIESFLNADGGIRNA